MSKLSRNWRLPTVRVGGALFALALSALLAPTLVRAQDDDAPAAETADENYQSPGAREGESPWPREVLEASNEVVEDEEPILDPDSDPVPPAPEESADEYAAEEETLERELADEESRESEPGDEVSPEDLEIPEEIAETLEMAFADDPLVKVQQKGGDDKAAAKGDAKKDAAKPDSDWTDLSTDKWTIKLGGHLQLDQILWADATDTIPAQNYFEFRRVRLMADGTGYGVYDFRVMLEVSPEAQDTVTPPVAQVKDAYLSMNDIPYVGRFRIGNFFVPFSLEQVTNDTMNIFLERSIPTQGIFAADREVGIASYGVSDDLRKTWTFGAFIDSISESNKARFDNNPGQRLSGRLTWLPYYDEPSNGRYLVHTGVGVLYTHDQDGSVRFAARPQIHDGPRLIDSGVLPAGSFVTGNLEFATVCGPLSLQSEWFLCNVNLTNQDSANLYGGYVYLSYFLTGENRVYERYGQHGAQFGRNVPFSNFFLVPGGYGPGAWEFKARSSYLDEGEVSAGRYNDMTIGFNWYWTERVRFMFDWIHPWTTANTVYGVTQSDILGMRFDFNF
jgi:phosphate-selective porin OprO/OprP